MQDNNSFNSLDKLMEFGMSLAVAQQMMQTMNHALSNMQTPLLKDTNMSSTVPKHFFALVNDIPQGPFTESELTGHIMSGRVLKDTMVWLQGMRSWMPADQVTDVNKLFALVPPSIK